MDIGPIAAVRLDGFPARQRDRDICRPKTRNKSALANAMSSGLCVQLLQLVAKEDEGALTETSKLIPALGHDTAAKKTSNLQLGMERQLNTAYRIHCIEVSGATAIW